MATLGFHIAQIQTQKMNKNKHIETAYTSKTV